MNENAFGVFSLCNLKNQLHFRLNPSYFTVDKKTYLDITQLLYVSSALNCNRKILKISRETRRFGISILKTKIFSH